MDQNNNTDFHCCNIQHKMAEIVCANAIMNPGAVTGRISIMVAHAGIHILVVFRYAALTPPAVLTS